MSLCFSFLPGVQGVSWDNNWGAFLLAPENIWTCDKNLFTSGPFPTPHHWGIWPLAVRGHCNQLGAWCSKHITLYHAGISSCFPWLYNNDNLTTSDYFHSYSTDSLQLQVVSLVWPSHISADEKLKPANVSYFNLKSEFGFFFSCGWVMWWLADKLAAGSLKRAK